MLNFIRQIFIALSLTLMMGLHAFAQDAETSANITINDLAGNWRIEVIERPHDDFKGTAKIPRSPDDNATTIMAETITEDKCCGGKNHARVLQDSRITISENGEIFVESRIVKYLLREEEVDIGYSADDFVLRWEDAYTLIGTANGWTPVRWVRDRDLVS